VYASSGTPSSALVVLLALALPGPLAAAYWWWQGKETRNVSLEDGSADVAMASWAEAAVTGR
jgi:hypothetical protein